MKNPREMRARAERYRGHARAMSDPVVRDVIRSVADNLEHEANRIERERLTRNKSAVIRTIRRERVYAAACREFLNLLRPQPHWRSLPSLALVHIRRCLGKAYQGGLLHARRSDPGRR